jgi:hypothetical protein
MSDLFLTGALVLVGLFVVMRIVKKGRGRNYGESKKAFQERLRKTSAQTRDQTLSAGVSEQMLPVAAAIRELLDSAGYPPDFALSEEGRAVRLQSPAGEIRIDFGLSHVHTAGKHKTGQSQVRWRISGPGAEEKEYMELADAVDHVKRIIVQNENFTS